MRLPWLWCVVLVSACAPDFQVQQRPFDVLAPKDASPETPLPLVVLLHGYAASAWAQSVVAPFQDVVEPKQFVLARPNGTVNSLGKRFWNGSDYCCDFDRTNVDDVSFLRAVIDDVKSKRAITKVFVIGHSNGGFMGLRMACEASDAIDGVVSLAGSTWSRDGNCEGGRVVPVLLVHGTKDETILYEGSEGQYPSARETFRRFQRRAECDEAKTLESKYDFLGNADTETTGEAPACNVKAVELWTMQDITHVPAFDERWTGAVIDWLQEKSK
ncbi:MAG: alpha/beta fold hydrolase [Archangium sp.]|nr:alpha/beta fold hydrolase [Archangium sp.]